MFSKRYENIVYRRPLLWRLDQRSPSCSRYYKICSFDEPYKSKQQVASFSFFLTLSSLRLHVIVASLYKTFSCKHDMQNSRIFQNLAFKSLNGIKIEIGSRASLYKTTFNGQFKWCHSQRRYAQSTKMNNRSAYQMGKLLQIQENQSRIRTRTQKKRLSYLLSC